jgi:hypothetical protein
MCDYSLEVYGSRPARESERCVTTRFPSGTIGLASPAKFFKVSTPVCLNCGTTLEIENIPAQMCREYGLQASEDAVFIRLDGDSHSYRDGVRFRNGAEVSLQKFPPGVGFTVKQLLENALTLELERPEEALIGHS